MIDNLIKKGLINTPSFVKNNVHYEVVSGSIAYGIEGESSDWDIYSFCIPTKELLFPHLAGEIFGFGKQINRFEQYQQHGIVDKDSGREYDIVIYNIVKFFQLCMENNPNMIDTLFVPQRCILKSTKIGNIVRENRKKFLHKGGWHRFKGYAYSQLNKVKSKNPEGKRKAIVEKYGYDIKYSSNIVRLLNEIEMILTEHDLDLERNREQLKSIRRGEWKLSDIEDYFQKKEKELETIYLNSTLPYSPDEKYIKQLLIDCLEEHFGSLDKCVVINKDYTALINDLETLIYKYKGVY